MLDQTGNSEGFEAFYTNAGAAATGLTVTVTVRNPAGTAVVTGATATEVGGGFYTYTLSSTLTTTAGTYRAVFTTSGTVDQKDQPSVWILGKAWVAHVDADVSSRSTYAGGPVASVTGTVNATLVATGLDAIDAAPPTHASLGSWTFPQRLMWLMQRFRRVDRSPTVLTVKTDSGVTISSQAVADDGNGTESVGLPT